MNNNIQVFHSTIMEGDTGDDVIILQDKLKVLGYYDSSITGSFDRYTKEAVIRFQQRNNLSPTGIGDEDTWRQLYILTSNPVVPMSQKEARPTLRLGSTGIYVTELQTDLTNLLYYTGSINGNFDIDTQTAVKRFQTNNRLPPDGIVGRDTWSALATLYTPLAICEGGNNGTNTQTYTVVAGDSLWSIAQRFKTTVDILKRLNNLMSNTILVGQTLLIPTSEGNVTPPADNHVYTVVAGDTLFMGNNE